MTRGSNSRGIRLSQCFISDLSGEKLTSNDLGLVLNEVLEVSTNWYVLGLQLNVRTGTLDRIRSQFPDPNDQLREMLKAWLKTSNNPTWKTLTDALRSRSVGASQLAGDLKTKYCKVEGTKVDRDTSASDYPETSVFPPSPESQSIPLVILEQTDTQESTRKDKLMHVTLLFAHCTNANHTTDAQRCIILQIYRDHSKV